MINGNKIETSKVEVDPRYVQCVIGCEQVDFLVDSGATVNTITGHVWETIQRESKSVIQDVVLYPKDVLKGYANEKPLDVLCSFAAYIGIKQNPAKMEMAKFFVVKGTTWI